MNQNSKNGLDLIKIAGSKTNKQFGKAFLGSALYMLPLLVLAFVGLVDWQVSIALCSVALFYVCLFAAGYAKFFGKIVRGEEVSIGTIFAPTSGMVTGLFLSLILVVLYAVGFALFIVPAFIIITFYSMSIYFLTEKENASVSEVMKMSSKYMTGKRTAMFAYKIIFYILFAIVITAYVFGMIAVSKLPIAGAIPAYIGVALLELFLLGILSMYYQASNAVLFEEIKVYNENKKSKNKVVKAEEVKVEETAAEVKTEEPVEEKPVEVAKTRKTTTKSATAKKSTSTTKKSTTSKSTTAKKSTAKKPAAKKEEK